MRGEIRSETPNLLSSLQKLDVNFCFPVNTSSPNMTNTSAEIASLRVAACTPDREEDLVNLFLSGMQEHRAKWPDLEGQKRFQKFLDNAVSNLRNPPPTISFHIVLTPSDELVAMAGLSRTPKDALSNTAEVTRISVDKQWRRRGICKMLLAHIIRIAVELYSVDTLYLTTGVDFEIAIQAYTAMGFRDVGRLEGKPFGTKMVMEVADNDWWRE